MAINWYPGHMHKANKEMTEILPQVDLVIELLDCRLPYSSQNPAITKLGKNKPCIKILSKSDLADPDITAQWQAYFERMASVKTFLTTLNQPDRAQKFLHLCHKLAPAKSKMGSNILAMITGIPNVGKSTLINAVAGRKVAKTGDEPAITKGLQKIRLDHGIIFLDTPGILWPKIHNANSGYRLAATGAIKNTAMEVEDVALYLSGFLLQHYPQLLLDRYELGTIPATDIEFLELMGTRRGCLRGGGHVDLEKVSAILVNEFRAGKLGRITLETPDMILAEEKIVAQQRREKAARDELRKKKKQGSRANSGRR
ncbi:MAG: ribosome biogenesis GTPase YlqF [Gammaproteobacteria bacterium]|nr:MAG: ribosome biogenesis GTPase YlqF [Gammaproteobacteria bacterium]RLA60182.1 MAG: ribosome biogenesis GTPase YlqF [Gammaproteobacteria bacterium]